MKVHREKTPRGTLLIRLSGVLDHESDIARLFRSLPEEVEIDLREVDRINSMGVRDWVAAMSQVPEHVRITVHRVSYPMAMQALCVHNFFGSAHVASCMAPYSCLSCGRVDSVVVTREEAKQEGPPTKHCRGCNSEMCFDELDQYLNVFEAGT